MFDEKTILARLQNGEDAQKIADEMAAMINAANKTYTDQKAAEEAAKAQAAKVELQKKEELQEIINLFMEWLETFYGVKTREEVSADSVIELIDSLKEYIEAMKGLEAMFGVKNATKPTAKVIKSNTKPKNADETLNAFLKQMGW